MELRAKRALEQLNRCSELSRRQALAALGSLTAGACFVACSGSNSSPANSPLPAINAQPVPSGPLTAATVDISSTESGAIPAGFVGLSYEKFKLSQPLFSAGNVNLLGLFKRLGPGLLRIGGNSVDQTSWKATGAGQTSCETAPSDINALAGFLTAAGWSVLYGVNLAQSTPVVAAAEVAYAVKALGASLIGIEIGNETDNYPGQYFPSTWTYSDYFARWQSFASAILTHPPAFRLMGPRSPSKRVGSVLSSRQKARTSPCSQRIITAATGKILLRISKNWSAIPM